jgi:hypothetical protein
VGELPGMMEHEVTRTLVKSQPEIWAQCSVAESLERHLSWFGEIRITRLEPEHAVAWEGEQVRGTVRIEPSAWGTRVTMAVRMQEEDVAALVDAAEPVDAAGSVAAAGPMEAGEPRAGRPPSEPVPAPEGSDKPAAAPVAPEPVASQSPGRFGRWWDRFRRPARFEAGSVGAAPAAMEASLGENTPEALVEAALPRATAPHEAVSEEAAPREAASEEAVSEARAQQAQRPDPEERTRLRPDAEAALNAALESLGQAHHRPYSRA